MIINRMRLVCFHADTNSEGKKSRRCMEIGDDKKGVENHGDLQCGFLGNSN